MCAFKPLVSHANKQLKVLAGGISHFSLAPHMTHTHTPTTHTQISKLISVSQDFNESNEFRRLCKRRISSFVKR